MVGIRIVGQLGNHMFQYAFIYSVSKKLSTPFFIKYGNIRITQPQITKYFHVQGYNSLNNFILSKKNKYLHTLGHEIHLNALNIPEEELKKISNNTLYYGYAQSEQYFSFSGINFQKVFTIKNRYVNYFNKKYGGLFKKNKTIVIHVRRTDYKEAGGDIIDKDLRLPDTYYFNVLKQIPNKDNFKIIFISDDIDYCKQHFSNLNNCTFESNDAIIDFQLMMHADICILSNSTFCWWAAYLNTKPNKKIFAPRNWLGFRNNIEYPTGITNVSGWNLIDVIE